MAGDLSNVSRGDPMRISASTWNSVLEATRRSKASTFEEGRGGPRGGVDGSRVLVRNLSGADVPRFGVLAIAGVAIEPDANLAEFQNHPVLDGVTPFGGLRTFLIAQDPIPEGGIGFGVASGVSVSMVHVDGEADAEAYAFATMGSTTQRLTAVESGAAEILWREPGTGEKWAVVRLGNTPTDAVAGVVTLGIVIAPSSNGAAVTSYTVDIYGTTIDSLFDAAVETSEVATQDPVDDKYWRGEIVGLTQVGSGWKIQKLLSTPVAYTVGPQQVCLRLWKQSNDSPTNFLLDLAECLAYFDGGTVDTLGSVAFGFGPYVGFANFSKATSVPVRFEPGWNLVTPRGTVGASFSTLIAAELGSWTTATGSVSNGIDSVPIETNGSPPTSPFAPGWQHAQGDISADAPGTVTETFNAQGSERLLWGVATQFNARVEVSFSSTSDLSALFSGAPTLPSITGGVDNTSELLLAYVTASLTVSGGVITGAATTRSSPDIIAAKPVPTSGGSFTGSYDFVIDTIDLSGPVEVS